MNITRTGTPSLWAQGLGYGGLIPFVGLALAIGVWPRYQAQAAVALVGYGATIASFLGAIHWGLTLRDAQGQSTRLLAWGVVPSLLAWVALMLSAVSGLLLIAVLLWVCFGVDRLIYKRAGLHAWLPMRLSLTTIASLSCFASATVLLKSTP